MSDNEIESSPTHAISRQCSIVISKSSLISKPLDNPELEDEKDPKPSNPTKSSIIRSLSTRLSLVFTDERVEQLQKFKRNSMFVMLSPFYFLLLFIWTGICYPIGFILWYTVGPVLFFIASIFWGGCLEGFGMMVMAEIVTAVSSIMIVLSFFFYSLFYESPRYTRRMVIEQKMPYVSKERNYWYEYWQVIYSKAGLVLENPYAGEERRNDRN